MRFKYTESEKSELLKNLLILVDTKEKENKHILAYFDKFNIPYKTKKLDVGDYSFQISKNDITEFNHDIVFDDEIVIERKNSVLELAGNLSNGRDRFERELIRGSKIQKILMVEDENGYSNIKSGSYTTYCNYSIKSYISTLYTFEDRYNLKIKFVPKELAGEVIFLTFFYYFRNKIMGRKYQWMNVFL